MPETARPARFERIDGTALSLANALAPRRLQFEWQRGASAVCLELRAAHGPLDADLSLCFEDHQGPVQLRSSDQLLRALSTPWRGESPSRELPLPLVRALLSPLLDWVGGLLKADLGTPVPAGRGEQGGVTLGLWDVTGTADRPVATLQLGAGYAPALLEAIEALPLRVSPVDTQQLSTAINLDFGRSSLTIAEYRGLGAGDILLMPVGTFAGDHEVVIRQGTRPLATATLTGDRSLVVSRPLHHSLKPGQEAPPMNEDYDEMPEDEMLYGEDDSGELVDFGSDANPDPGSPDDLQVTLDFSLGRMELPLSAIEELGEGYCLELDMPAAGRVEVSSGGRHVGFGELVQIDDRLGVRLTRLAGTDRG